jgi:hypothetical protein
MAEFGIRKGLAQSFGYDQATADLARQQDQMRQAKIYAENKAKMLAEDFDYNSAINAWDNTAIKEYAQGKIKELGAFVRENPDYLYNVDKRIAYNNIKRELKDSKPLMEGLQVDANVKEMEKWKNDPKNAPLLDTPEFQKTLQDYQNYVKTGSTDGNTVNRKLFTFYPPEERMDTLPKLMKYANETEYDLESTVGLGLGSAAKKFAISDNRKGQAADAALRDMELGRTLQQEYNVYLSGLPEGERPLSLKQYTVNKMNPYFPSNKYDKYSYSVREPKSGSGAGLSSSERLDLYDSLIKNAASKPGQKIAANPKGANEIISGGQNALKTGGLYFDKGNGDYVPLKDFVTPNFTTSNSTVKYDPVTKKAFVSTTLTLPADEANDIFDGAEPLDIGFWFWNEDKAKEGFEKGITFEGDNVNIEVWKPVEIDNRSTNAAYNHAAGQTLEKSETGQEATQSISKKALVEKYGKENADIFIQKYSNSVNITD